MYDRRPASRVALGTPTVTVGFTPPVRSAALRGSCQLAMSSPLPGARCPLHPEYIVDAEGDFKRNRTSGVATRLPDIIFTRAWPNVHQKQQLSTCPRSPS